MMPETLVCSMKQSLHAVAAKGTCLVSFECVVAMFQTLVAKSIFLLKFQCQHYFDWMKNIVLEIVGLCDLIVVNRKR